MVSQSKIRFYAKFLLPGGVFLTVVVIAAMAWWIMGGSDASPGVKLAYGTLTLLFASSLGLLTWGWSVKRFQAAESIQEKSGSRVEQGSLQRRLDGVIQLNELLIGAQNEDELIEKALGIISEVVGSSGASFVPFDEWGQPLRSYVYGAYPAPILTPWSNHLSSAEVRHRCQTCINLQGDSGTGCPLIDAPFTDIVRITCFPLKRNNRTVGIVNLYLRNDQKISQEVNDYLLVILNEMALAIEITRLRNQELTTLRQLQLVHSQPEELKTILAKLVTGLCEVLDFKYTRTIFRSAEPAFPGIEVVTGDDPWLLSIEAENMLRQTIQLGISNGHPAQMERQSDGSSRILLPFCLPEGTIIGAVLMTGASFTELTPRQTALIDTVTTQAAVLVENERRHLETEYRTVMQERIRLAREIHDSLAQTLAYLKLTSAQMQSQLAQGDLVRLAQTLQHSHEALSDAYLETRQVIDNLRLAPQQDMDLWLTQIIQNFEQISGLKVNLDIPDRLPQINPEIQAQLVRIIQEAFNNIRKHSQASKVWIVIHGWNNHLVLDLSDDGIGFSSDDIPDFSRHGLRGMRERAELIGADFQITSQIGQGTTIHLELPIQVQETTA